MSRKSSGLYLSSELVEMYSFHPREIPCAVNNGLPFIVDGKHRYFRLEDVHAYYSGLIGHDADIIAELAKAGKFYKKPDGRQKWRKKQ